MKPNNNKITIGSIGKVFAKFHLTIFIVVFVGGLAFAVIILTNIFNDSSPVTTDSISGNQTNLNQQTIDKITQQGDSKQYNIPDGRTNPFSE